MADIINLKPPSRKLIRLDSGTVTGPPGSDDVGRIMYFLEYEDRDGARGIPWQGGTHEEALLAAQEWQKDGFRLIDMTQDDGGEA